MKNKIVFTGQASQSFLKRKFKGANINSFDIDLSQRHCHSDVELACRLEKYLWDSDINNIRVNVVEKYNQSHLKKTKEEGFRYDAMEITDENRHMLAFLVKESEVSEANSNHIFHILCDVGDNYAVDGDHEKYDLLTDMTDDLLTRFSMPYRLELERKIKEVFYIKK